MYTLIVVLAVVVSILLAIIVLVQESKGGGLASSVAGANSVLGVRKTTDFLEKTTWTLAILLVVFCLASSIAIPKNGVQGAGKVDTQLRSEIQNTVETPVTTETAE